MPCGRHLPSYLQIFFCPTNCSKITCTHPGWSTYFWQLGWVLHFQVWNLQDYFFITSFPLFIFLSVISNRHLQQMLSAFSLPCTCCPISSCSSGVHIHHTGEHACSSDTSHKASATFLQHGRGTSWGFKATAHGFFQCCSRRHCPAWIYQSGTPISVAPFYDSGQTHLFSPALPPGLRGKNDFTVASPKQHHFHA